MDLSAKWVRALYVSLMIGVAIITGSLFIVVSTLNRQNSEDRSEYRQSLIWYTAQLVVEYQDLMHALNTMIVHDGGEDHRQEVSARFDILWSRAMRLDEGEAGQELVRVDGSVPLMAELEKTLLASDPLIKRISAGDVGAARKLRGDFEALQSTLDSFRSAVYRLQLEAASRQRGVLQRTVDLVLFLIIGLLVAGVSMGLLLLRDRRRLVRLQTQLERRVAERTGELAHANAELLSANERLTQFNNLASHDLKEPVRKITVFSDLLLEGVANSDSETIDYAANVMRASAGRAKTLISNLLNYSAASDRELSNEPVRLSVLIDRVRDSLSERVREGEAEIVLSEGDAELLGDPVFLEQLFQNLVGNAIKFRDPERRPRIEILAERDENGTPTSVVVRDNGIGFDMAHKAQVFEPFRRLHPRDRYAGTGMGLAICSAIARRHGWDLDATSVPGEGSTFRIDFAPGNRLAASGATQLAAAE
ncbi:ATP-binding protein [Stappia sp. MMSF_3263]|uniref:sensor histidine kinase n=1 Tax=Stappia sp. MMSF_3263 TaxID=3046693 RepID=UPI00273EF96C|nr:ATP-binding protein [Stappia sp. MMSF_3263]